MANPVRRCMRLCLWLRSRSCVLVFVFVFVFLLCLCLCAAPACARGPRMCACRRACAYRVSPKTRTICMTLSLAALSGTGFTPCAFASFRRDWTTATRSFGMGMGNGDCVLKKLGRSALHSNSRTTKLEPKQLNPTHSGDRGGDPAYPCHPAHQLTFFKPWVVVFMPWMIFFNPALRPGWNPACP